MLTDRKQASRHRPWWLRALLATGGLTVLVWVFGLYLQPDFMLDLVNIVWGCA